MKVMDVSYAPPGIVSALQ